VTTYDRREIITRRIEYAIPTGSDMGTFDRVRGIAWQDFCQRRGHDPQAAYFDDWAEVDARDEEIAIVFAVDEKPAAADETLKRIRDAHAELSRREATNSGHGRDGHLNLEDLDLICRAFTGGAP
jgi:hypothetical protein